MDLFTAIAADLGMTLEIVPVIPLGDMVAAIQAGTVDTYGGNISMTPARAEQVAFADPWYLNVGEGAWVLRSDLGVYRSVYDFSGQIVGAQRDSATYRGLVALGIFPEIRQYDNQDLLAEAVVAGEVKAGFLPYDTSAYLLFQGFFPDLKIPEGYEGSVNYGFLIAMPFSKDNLELVERVNGSLARLAENGTLQSIFANYGLDWRLPTTIR
jgi:polar amino acid transport system substrate-binding protein